MAESTPVRLAVLGSPIEHSKSPSLHRAAYAQLGLGWEYTAIEVDGGALPASARSASVVVTRWVLPVP